MNKNSINPVLKDEQLYFEFRVNLRRYYYARKKEYEVVHRLRRCDVVDG
jgi:hypothetical protein